jgi:adenosylcobinamide kinase / adenosylcobinamide-phosphate guanylyltransferase
VITLVLGGARSGKSVLAESLVSRHPAPVTYVATIVPGGDPDLEARIATHRQRRDPSWRTVEAAADLVDVLAGVRGSVLLDSVGPWVASAGAGADASALCQALRGREGDTVVVSEEVGLSVHPSSEAGRRFQDALGTVNHALSAAADAAYLVVAGRALALPPVSLAVLDVNASDSEPPTPMASS